MWVGFFPIFGREEGKGKQEALSAPQSARSPRIGNHKMKNSRCKTVASDFLHISTNVKLNNII